MSSPAPPPSAPWRRPGGERGSVLLVALLLAIALGLGLAGYLNLSRTSLQLSSRTFLDNQAGDLAEAGLEEAVYCFNRMGAGATPADAWSDWTTSGSDAMRTLTPFNLGQHAVGVVKIYVHGYDGAAAGPYAIAQATVTPFDGSAPLVRIVQISLRQTAGPVGLAALDGLNLKGSSTIDSFNSNPAGNPDGPWADYSAQNAEAKASVGVAAGSVAIASGEIRGDLHLAAGIAPPPAGKVTGTISSDFSGGFPLPAWPTADAVSRSYDLGSHLPSELPEAGDEPASDGRYYYFCRNTAIGSVSIRPGDNVVIVGSGTDLSAGLTVGDQASCTLYIDGVITLGTNSAINDTNWAGALHIYTTTTGTCAFSNNSRIHAVLYAPNAALRATGSGNKGQLVGRVVAKTITFSGKTAYHYDEALAAAGGSQPWTVTSWYDRQSSADRAAVGSLTGGFLP